ncbi:MAG: hypothetical protein ACOZAN_05150 [Patescibacteria group bacterium]
MKIKAFLIVVSLLFSTIILSGCSNRNQTSGTLNSDTPKQPATTQEQTATSSASDSLPSTNLENIEKEIEEIGIPEMDFSDLKI